MSSHRTSNVLDATALADELTRFRIIAPDTLTALLAEFTGTTPAALVEFLVKRSALTPFQANQVLVGEARLLALGPYRPIGPAGTGTFGDVYTATHRIQPGAAFRIRVFPLRSLWRAKEAKQLVRTLATAPHHLVVSPTDADSANGFHYIVWPHVAGESLTGRVAAFGPLRCGEATGLLAHLADALYACHSQKITHGALTPGSVVLAPDGLPRLLELGAGALLAANLVDDESLLDSMSSSVAACEILEYAAPEFAAEPVPSPAVDQYALGAIGYFALSGQPPFPKLPLAEQLAAKQAGPPTSLELVNPAVRPELAAIIDRMLRPSPADRFAGLDEVQERLSALAGSLHDAHPSEPAARLPAPLHDAPASELLPLAGSEVWPPPESGVTQFPTRDDSEATISFELPEQFAEEVEEEAGKPGARAPAAQGDTPAHGMRVTPAHPLVLENRKITLAPSPPPSSSPVRDTSRMAKSEPSNSPDPRLEVGTPIHYQTEATRDADASSSLESMTPPPLETPELDDRPVTESALWKKLKRNLLFWQAPTDVVQVSVFGSLAIAPGQPTRVTVFLHCPDATDSVRTLSRAFHHDSELIGSGFVAHEVARDTELAVHISVMNAGVTKSLMKFIWRGQPQRLVFDLHVPWEAPSGQSPGLISVGRDDVRIGKTEFRLNLLPRKG
jgi:serine/threonine-protein kinase